jgi:hypothetical protein
VLQLGEYSGEPFGERQAPVGKRHVLIWLVHKIDHLIAAGEEKMLGCGGMRNHVLNLTRLCGDVQA